MGIYGVIKKIELWRFDPLLSPALREKIADIIVNLSGVALTKRRMQTLRRIWKDYKNSKNWHVMIKQLSEFLKEKPSDEEPEAVEFDEKRLKLICVQFIT